MGGGVSGMGVWRIFDIPLWETAVTPCDCCGQVVAKRFWVVEICGTEKRFCSEECETLFRRYVLTKHEGG